MELGSDDIQRYYSNEPGLEDGNAVYQGYFDNQSSLEYMTVGTAGNEGQFVYLHFFKFSNHHLIEIRPPPYLPISDKLNLTLVPEKPVFTYRGKTYLRFMQAPDLQVCTFIWQSKENSQTLSLVPLFSTARCLGKKNQVESSLVIIQPDNNDDGGWSPYAG